MNELRSDKLDVKNSKSVFFSFGFIFCLLMILVMFGIRNVMVLSDMWAVYDGADFPESMTVGNFAYDVLDGTWRGWNCYLGMTEGHTGWAIIPGVVAIPLYFFFGNSFLTLCQVPMLFSAVIICLLYWFCIKYFDRTTALIAVSFYVFLPRHIQGWALFANSDLLEAPLYTLGGLSLFLKAYEAKTQPRHIWIALCFLFGLVSGIGIFHSEIYVLVLIAIFITCLFYEPRFLIHRNFVLFFVGGFLIGLIPYFLASPMMSLSYAENWSDAKFGLSTVYAQSKYVSKTLNNAISSLFWFVRYLSFGLLKGVPLLLVGLVLSVNPQRGFRMKKGEQEISKVDIGAKTNFVLNIIRVFAFLYIFVAISVILTSSEAVFESYVFPAVAYLCILFAIMMRDIAYKIRAAKMVMLQTTVFVIVAICCGYNCLQIYKELRPAEWGRQKERLLLMKGCNFYWPFGYRVPQGYKTTLTKDVEKVGNNKLFYDQPLGDANTTVIIVEDVTYPIKKICVNKKINRFGFQLLHGKEYLVYGIDVTFSGLETLANEIQSRPFSEKERELAFMSLAVYYNSDHWMSFLFDAYRQGQVSKVVPEFYRKYFYQEFGRRLRSERSITLEKMNTLIAELTDEQKSDIIEGFKMVDSYVSAQPFHR